MKTKNAEQDIASSLEVVALIRERMDSFTPMQRVLAEYLVHHPEALLFMTIQQLAREAAVSQATIIRFCNLLGYKGFAQMIKEAQQIAQSQMGAVGRFRIIQDQAKKAPRLKGQAADGSVFEQAIECEVQNLSKLGQSIKTEDFNQSAKAIQQADRICIIGCTASSILAGHFGRMLCKVKPDVDVIENEGVLALNKLLQLTKSSLVFLLAFPRYPNQTLRLGEAAADSGARIIAITDSHVSPISGMGDITFHINVGITSFVDNYAAPLTFINALVTQAARQMPRKAENRMVDYDRMAKKTDLFRQQIRRGRPCKK